MSHSLPDFVRPMLAKASQPFDSDEHLFEVKWDGLRTTAYRDRDAFWLRSRSGGERTERYPDLEELRRLPEGSILDGEMIVLDSAGKPDFRAALLREQAQSSLRIRHAAREHPATFVVFDQLYAGHRDIMLRPLRERRARLTETVRQINSERIVVSDGVIGPGKAFFDQVVAQELEGLVAKRLDSKYAAGRRSDAWLKMRRRSTLLCAIIGYVPKADDFESLILAADDRGDLRCVGRVGSGFSQVVREELNDLLRRYETPTPLIACPHRGTWLEPGLFCQVNFFEWTPKGELREPTFERLVDGPSPSDFMRGSSS